MIAYETTAEGIRASDLEGFFAGWPVRPSPERHLALLRGSDLVVRARDPASGKVVGSVTAISDGVLSAYIPLLEVLPEYEGRAIGSELVGRLFEQLRSLYMVDLCCDEDLVPFYERLGMARAVGMMVRNRDALAE